MQTTSNVQPYKRLQTVQVYERRYDRNDSNFQVFESLNESKNSIKFQNENFQDRNVYKLSFLFTGRLQVALVLCEIWLLSLKSLQEVQDVCMKNKENCLFSFDLPFLLKF